MRKTFYTLAVFNDAGEWEVCAKAFTTLAQAEQCFNEWGGAELFDDVRYYSIADCAFIDEEALEYEDADTLVEAGWEIVA